MHNISVRDTIKRCVLDGIKQSETIKFIQRTSSGDNSLSPTQIKYWFNQFKNGRQAIKDLSNRRRGLTVTDRTNVIIARELILEDRQITIDELADRMKISHGSAHTIVSKNLNMKRVEGKWIPRKLSEIEREKRIDVCRQNLRKFKRKMNSIVTMDESWVYFYDPKTTKELQMWKSPDSPQPKAVKSARFVKKVMLIAFFDSRGMVYYDFVKKGSTVNGKYFIRSCRKAISRARIRLNFQPLLHFDNAPCHRSREVNDFFTESDVQVVPHPPYSPDLAPCDFFLFPKLKKYLRGHIYASEKELKRTVSYYLNRVQETAFKNSFDNWIKR